MNGSEKSQDAFRTISEVGEALGLPQHVLRFWETRFAQIRPLKRGGGRRYYRPEDVDLVRAIQHLLYNEGYTIKGVQRILKEKGVRAVVAAGEAMRRDGRAKMFVGEAIGPAIDDDEAFVADSEPARRREHRETVSLATLQALLSEIEACVKLLDGARTGNDQG